MHTAFLNEMRIQEDTMKKIKSLSIILVLVMALSMLWTMPAMAAETGTLWLRAEATADGVVVSVWANTTVTDGNITVKYSSSTLTYTDITVDESYVLAHAVNAQTLDAVQIAWVAPENYGNNGTEHMLMQLLFAGNNVDGFSVSGYFFDGEGTKLTVTPPEGFNMLQIAIESAKALKGEVYTTESYAKLMAALDAARAELSDPAVTSERLEATRQNVIAAVQSLVKLGEEPVVPETTAAPSVPATDPVGSQPQGGNVGLIIAVVAACVVAAVVVVIVLKRKGNKR
jgi:hypothetical protein